ncbi:SDR family oxidoreductase [Leifsonia sp. 21MFCrub1.1]|uniref:SDR family oxidoreductase n=1 Tax=Leifsonia sp. 21MFCrub1.1 TaxID=1798223 RepID=UPI0008929BC6|nr:SDR family oxidoreductase [Leifsonia sp. 21MFCrub1.1]SEA46317.1 NAD(P)-dependent dehydrogenase, short-chain alcohol dehydrogenase family [Leifsonia sp. 21MFCrub1.1]
MTNAALRPRPVGNELTDQRVIVIGGTSGIGLATAQRSAALGAEIVVASRNAESVATALTQLPESSTGHALDVRDPDMVREFFDLVGPHDHLAYTAGDELSFGALADNDIETMRSFLNVRLWGAVAAVRAALPYVRRSITLSGGAGMLRPTPGFTTAAIALGAIEAFTRAAASELAPVRVNAVYPGVVRSPLWRGMSAEEQDMFFAETAASIPVGRVGESEDIAGAFTHLMINDYTTGQTLVADGGATIGAR